MKRIEIDPGTKFGRLTAVERRGLKWLCRCECGAEKEIQAGSLRYGYTKSCGCWLRTKGVRNVTHGHSKGGVITPTYTSWYAMRQRCSNPRNQRYPSYGARGIRVCERWQEFEAFLADMGERPAGMTIDRKDVNGNYEPSNCRWATDAEQRAGRRCSISSEAVMQAAWFVIDERIPRRQVAKAFGVSVATVARLINSHSEKGV